MSLVTKFTFLADRQMVRRHPLPVCMPEMTPIPEEHRGKKCLALDLDETLVHSSFQVLKLSIG